MYAGHFALGLALKARRPEAPTWGLLLGTGLLDLLFGPFALLVLAACGYHWTRARDLRSFGGRAGWACVVVTTLHLLNSPWLAPTR